MTLLMLTLLLLALLAASIAAFVKPDFRAGLLARVGITANDAGTNRVVSIVNGILVFVFADAVFGGLIALLAVLACVAYVNRDRIGL